MVPAHNKRKLLLLFNEQPKEIDGSYQGFCFSATQAYSCHRMHLAKVKLHTAGRDQHYTNIKSVH